MPSPAQAATTIGQVPKSARKHANATFGSGSKAKLLHQRGPHGESSILQICFGSIRAPSGLRRRPVPSHQLLSLELGPVSLSKVSSRSSRFPKLNLSHRLSGCGVSQFKKFFMPHLELSSPTAGRNARGKRNATSKLRYRSTFFGDQEFCPFAIRHDAIDNQNINDPGHQRSRSSAAAAGRKAARRNAVAPSKLPENFEFPLIPFLRNRTASPERRRCREPNPATRSVDGFPPRSAR